MALRRCRWGDRKRHGAGLKRNSALLPILHRTGHHLEQRVTFGRSGVLPARQHLRIAHRELGQKMLPFVIALALRHADARALRCRIEFARIEAIAARRSFGMHGLKIDIDRCDRIGLPWNRCNCG